MQHSCSEQYLLILLVLALRFDRVSELSRLKSSELEKLRWLEILFGPLPVEPFDLGRRLGEADRSGASLSLCVRSRAPYGDCGGDRGEGVPWSLDERPTLEDGRRRRTVLGVRATTMASVSLPVTCNNVRCDVRSRSML